MWVEAYFPLLTVDALTRPFDKFTPFHRFRSFFTPAFASDLCFAFRFGCFSPFHRSAAIFAAADFNSDDAVFLSNCGQVVTIRLGNSYYSCVPANRAASAYYVQ